MSDEYIQLPPQGTGKKLGTEARTKIGYDNLTGSLFTSGEIITGATSGATGEVTGVEVLTSTTGNVFVSNYTGTFLNNENIDIDGIPVAIVNLTSTPPTLEQQKIIITDPDNPLRMQRIDRFGATVNTFQDGSPVFSPFGLMMVGQPQTIKNYQFAYGSNSSEFYDKETNGASITYQPTAGLMLFSNPTTAGSLSCRSSHFYHPYTPGIGTLVEISLAVGDLGKANVRRRWGYFDDQDGVFWQLDGTNLSVGLRSSVSGSVVDTIIPQSEFSEDKLLGSNSLAFTLDVTKSNIYMIDFQWLGSGRIRFIVMEPNGSRIIAHDIENANKNSTIPYMRTATLPIRVEQENTGVSGSTSELRWVCGTIKATSQNQITSNKIRSFSTGATPVAITTSETPIISGRPKQTFNGLTNRGIIRLRSVSMYNSGANAALIKVGGTLDSLMTGEVFASAATDSIAEIDTSATAVTLANVQSSRYLSPGQSETIATTTSEQVHTHELYLYGDGTTQPIICWTGTGIGGPTNVSIGLNWEEILA